MKHTILTLALLISSFVSALAYDFTAICETGQELAYTINEDKETISVVDRNSNSISGELIIPKSVEYDSKTYTVTWIEESAFYYCTGLTSVTIPNSVTSIGYQAFYNCTGLTSVTIPKSVTSIEKDAFYYCTGLTSVTIPNSVTSIGYGAFGSCTGLASVTIPNSVTSIGDNAFARVKNIVYHGEATGSPWSALTVNGTIDGDFIYSDAEKTNLTAYIGKDNNVVIPENVTSIGAAAFMGYTGLTSVTIPNSVTSIGAAAFGSCTGLTSVTITEGVTSIGDAAFENCTSLTSVTIPESVTSIGYIAFHYCTGLVSVTIPNTVTSIGDNAFTMVKNIVYHGEATGSPWGALTVNGTIDGDFIYSDVEKTNLTAYIGRDKNVVIPNGVTSIGSYAFSDCRGLTSVIISEGVNSIGYQAFRYCTGLTSVTITEGVTSIGEQAFENCTSLTSVTIPNSVTSIGNSAFRYCTGLTSVTIIEGVTSIEDAAFENCTGLTSVTIPNSVTSIGDMAFGSCTGLTSVTIPNSVTSIVRRAFLMVKNIVYHGEATGSPWGALTVNGTIDGDFIYSDAEKTNLTAYIGRDKNVVIPNGVTSIGSYVFYRTSVTSVIMTSLTPPVNYSSTKVSLSLNTLLYVPNEALEAYRNSVYWSEYKNIEPSTAEKVELTEDEVLVEPEAEKASLSFPIVESADSYLLTIYENDEINSTFTFNEQGQLTNIDASLKSSSIQGFLFTVTGLSAGTEYGYLLQALDANKNVLKEYSGSFTTQDKPLEIDCFSNEIAITIVNHQILVNGEAPAFVVTVSGQKIANANIKTGVYFVVVDGETIGVSVQ